MSDQASFDALDTRVLFRTYAAVGWVAGLFLYGWGGLVFRVPLDGGPTGSEWMAARVAGAALFGVGFFAHAMAGTDVRFSVGELPPSESLPPGAQQAVFRVAQEALANVARHARATHVLVALDSAPFSLQLRVEDDGVGFDSAQAAAGMGLSNMRARLEPLGGAVAVSSTPGVGTAVRVSVPHAPQPSEADVAAYRRRALVYVAFGLVWLATLPLWYLERGRLDLVMWGVLMVFNGVFAARAVSAYHRARRAGSSPAGKARTA